jgi:hypothetical protein
MTNKRKPAPAPKRGAAKIIEQMASEAASQKMIARRLGITLAEFKQWLEDRPELQEAYDAGHDANHTYWYQNLCMHAAKTQDVAKFILETRHGYRKSDPTNQVNRVAITFSIPAAQPSRRVLTVQSEPVIEHESGDQ